MVGSPPLNATRSYPRSRIFRVFGPNPSRGSDFSPPQGPVSPCHRATLQNKRGSGNCIPAKYALYSIAVPSPYLQKQDKRPAFRCLPGADCKADPFHATHMFLETPGPFLFPGGKTQIDRSGTLRNVVDHRCPNDPIIRIRTPGIR